MPSADKITTTCLLFAPSFAERLYRGDISNWKLPAGKEKRKTTLDHWRVKIMTTVIRELFKRILWRLLINFPPTCQHGTASGGSFNSAAQKRESLRACDFWRTNFQGQGRGLMSRLQGPFWLHPFVRPRSSAFCLFSACRIRVFSPLLYNWVSG